MREIKTLINDAYDVCLSDSFESGNSSNITIQATVSHFDSGHASSKVTILASNDNIDFMPLYTIDLVGTDTVSDGIASTISWPFYRARIEELSPQCGVKVTLGFISDD